MQLTLQLQLEKEVLPTVGVYISLQLAINDGLKEDTITEVLKIVRSIVEHFDQSSAAHQLLSNIQTQL